MMIRIFVTFFFYPVFHITCYSPNLRSTACFANDKKISYCLIYFPKVKRNNILSLFFLNCCNNGFDDF